MYYKSIIEAIGNTPLIQLHDINKGIKGTVLAKVEYFNPGHSMKDRMALKMIEDAEKAGLLKPGGTIIEGTSGNTGMGLALAAIAKGYKCIFTMSDKQSPEKVNILKALGAEVVVCPTNVTPEDPRSYYSVAKKLNQDIPNSFYPNQFDNLSNTAAHYETTGPEIWKQTDGKVTHFVTGIGTSGTLMGTSRGLKGFNPKIQTYAVEPADALHGLEGLKHMPSSIVPGIYKRETVDGLFSIPTEPAWEVCERLAKEEGILVGHSSGANLLGAVEVAKQIQEGIVVTVFCDSGERYL